MKLLAYCILLISTMQLCYAQRGADTLHFRKVYYFGGTGLALPLGKTKNVLSTKLFTGSMGLDISLKNPKYYLLPTLYMMSFGYDQLDKDQEYDRTLKNGRASIYLLSLAGGFRKQWQRLNTYSYIGPAAALTVEPRADQNEAIEQIDLSYKYSFAPAIKVGVGSDYKFKGFFLGFEVGYIHKFQKLQGNPVHVLTMMVGLKSDITKISDKVVEVISGNN
ncbi:hypothetical protein ACFRAE_00715 [Sphingobacterium sp. HJSM2_6]|uniref:hypothetical protein n=1 Tax=Sphingobacterium sp. HJSM2_6 TaxID=3366264 RepID=UPI003BD5B642